MQIAPYTNPVPNHSLPQNDNASAIPQDSLSRSTATESAAAASALSSSEAVIQGSWNIPITSIDQTSQVVKPKKKKRRRFGHRLKKFFKKIIKPLKKIFAPIIKILKQIPIVGQILNAASMAINSIKMWTALFKGDWKAFGKQLWKVVKDAVGSIPFPGASQLKMALEIAEKAYLAIRAGIKGNFGAMIGHVVNAVAAGVGGAKGFLDKISSKLPKLTDFVNKAVDFGKKAKDTVSGVFDKVKGGFSFIKDAIVERFPNSESIFGALKDFIPGLPQNDNANPLIMYAKDKIEDRYDRAA